MYNCVRVLGDQSISAELSDAFDAMLSTLAVHSQAGKRAVDEAGGVVLTRFKCIVIFYFSSILLTSPRIVTLH